MPFSTNRSLSSLVAALNPPGPSIPARRSQFPEGAVPYPGKGRFEGRMGYTIPHVPGKQQGIPAGPEAPEPGDYRAGELPYRDKGTPEQLPMFMSQREIMGKYQPLDADRQERYDDRAGEWTRRSHMTEGLPNSVISTNDRRAPFMANQDVPASAEYHRSFTEIPESHDEMMSRKLEESQMSYGEYAEVHGGGGGHTHRTPGWETAMGRSSAPQYEEGHTDTYNYKVDEHVGRLQDEHYMRQAHGSLYGDIEHAMRPGGEGFTGIVHLATGQFGSQGKPQIAGAHHRLAALGEIAPDRLLPVVHHEAMTHARWGPSAKSFPYT